MVPLCNHNGAALLASTVLLLVLVVSAASPTQSKSRSASATGSLSTGRISPTISETVTTGSISESQSAAETRSYSSGSQSASASRTMDLTTSPTTSPTASVTTTTTSSLSTSPTSRTRVISSSRSLTLSRSLTTVTAAMVKTSTASDSTTASWSLTWSPSRSSTNSHTSARTLTASLSMTISHTSSRTLTKTQTASTTMTGSRSYSTSRETSNTFTRTRASPTPSTTFGTRVRTSTSSESSTPSTTVTRTMTRSTTASMSRSVSSVTMKLPPTASLAWSTTGSGTTTQSLSDRKSITHDSASPTSSCSGDGRTASMSPTQAASTSGTQSYGLLFAMASIVDDVWATPVGQSDPSGPRFASSELQVSAALDGGTIPHDALRASAFDIYLHIRAEIAHRFFAAAPPIPLLIKGPSLTTYTRIPEHNLIVVTVSAVDFNRFEYRSFSVQLGPASWARVLEPCWFNLTVVPHAAIPIEIETRLNDAASATAVLFFSPVSSVLQSRSVIMTSLVVCQAGSVHKPFSILGVGVGERDSGYYYRGAIAGNLGLMAIAMSIPLTIAIVATAAARPKRRQTTWQRCCEVLHLPSSVVISGQLVLQPTIASSAALLYNWGTHADISAACVGITIALMYASFVTYFSLVRLPMSLEPRPAMTPRAIPSARSNSGGTTATIVVPQSVRTHYQTVMDACRGTMQWSAAQQRHKTWKRQHYFLFALHDSRYVLAMEMWIQLVVAAFAGIRLGITEYCAFHHILLAVVYGGLVVFHLVHQPLISLLHHVATVGCYGMWACAAVYAVVGLLLGYGGESTTLLDGTIVINVMTTCLAIVCAIPNGVYLLTHLRRILAALWHASEYRPPKDAPKQKPLVIVAAPAPPSPWVVSEPSKPPLPPAPPLGLPPPPRRRQTFRELTVLRQRDLGFGTQFSTGSSSSSSSTRSTSSSPSSSSDDDDTESMRSVSPAPMNPLPQSLHQKCLHSTGIPSTLDSLGSLGRADGAAVYTRKGSSSSSAWDGVASRDAASFAVPIKEVDDSML